MKEYIKEPNGTDFIYHNGKLCCINEVTLDGNHFIHWYKDGKLHNLNGPAVEFELFNGHKEWWRNGKRHRINGPAIEFSTGEKFWYWHGKPCSRHEYQLICNNRIDLNKYMLIAFCVITWAMAIAIIKRLIFPMVLSLVMNLNF